MLPVSRKSTVLFEGSQTLPACPLMWSIKMKQYEAMMKLYWQEKYEVKSGDQPPDLFRDTWRENFFILHRI